MEKNSLHQAKIAKINFLSPLKDTERMCFFIELMEPKNMKIPCREKPLSLNWLT